MENNDTNTENQAESGEVSAESKSGDFVDCLIHLRFQPNGTVSEIGERPASIDAQTWFNYLSKNTLNCYQALSGGRGLFKLPRGKVNALKVACTEENAT